MSFPYSRTSPSRPSPEPLDYLALEFAEIEIQQGHFSFLGFQYHWQTTRTGARKVQRRTDPEKLKKSTAAFSEWIQKNRHRRLPWLMKTLRAKLNGYLNYYGVTGNLDQICKYWRLVHRLLHEWMNRRSHKPSFTWKGLYATLERFKIPTPHITERPFAQTA
jgi:RNA-directed DNA polymerase